jgi:hypothetical protein
MPTLALCLLAHISIQNNSREELAECSSDRRGDASNVRYVQDLTVE